MGARSMFPPSSVKPMSQFSRGTNIGPLKTGFGPFNGVDGALLRENFTISTWLLMGCVIQSFLALAVPHPYAALPAILLLAWGIIDTLLMSVGLKQNSCMKDVVVGKFSVAYPAAGKGSAITGQPGDNGPGAIMILGTRSNSPLGIFEPGFKEIGDRFRDMMVQLEDEKETNGFMGMSTWIGAGERAGSNELSTWSYWRSVDDVHEFALSAVHRDAWKWWNESLAKHPKLGLMHEVYEVPKRNGFEGIYTNYHPTGLGATTKLIGGGSGDGGGGGGGGEKYDGTQQWLNPIIDARKGAYRSSRGRMARGDPNGLSNEKVAFDPYAVIHAKEAAWKGKM